MMRYRLPRPAALLAIALAAASLVVICSCAQPSSASSVPPEAGPAPTVAAGAVIVDLPDGRQVIVTPRQGVVAKEFQGDANAFARKVRGSIESDPDGDFERIAIGVRREVVYPLGHLADVEVRSSPASAWSEPSAEGLQTQLVLMSRAAAGRPIFAQLRVRHKDRRDWAQNTMGDGYTAEALVRDAAGKVVARQPVKLNFNTIVHAGEGQSIGVFTIAPKTDPLPAGSYRVTVESTVSEEWLKKGLVSLPVAGPLAIEVRPLPDAANLEAVRSLVRLAVLRRPARMCDPASEDVGQSPTRLDLTAVLKSSGQDADLAALPQDLAARREAVEQLAKTPKTWALAALLSDPDVDVKIRAARGLTRLADPQSAPVLLAAAKANNYDVPGSESATLHSVYREELQRGLEAITGAEITHPDRLGTVNDDFSAVEARLLAKYLPIDLATDPTAVCAEQLRQVVPKGWSVLVKATGRRGRIAVQRDHAVEVVRHSPVAPGPYKVTLQPTIDVHVEPWVSVADWTAMNGENESRSLAWSKAHPNYSPVELGDQRPYDPPTHFNGACSLVIRCELYERRYDWSQKSEDDECRDVKRRIEELYHSFDQASRPPRPTR
jgi:hypothetical protein